MWSNLNIVLLFKETGGQARYSSLDWRKIQVTKTLSKPGVYKKHFKFFSWKDVAFKINIPLGSHSLKILSSWGVTKILVKEAVSRDFFLNQTDLGSWLTFFNSYANGVVFAKIKKIDSSLCCPARSSLFREYLSENF